MKKVVCLVILAVTLLLTIVLSGDAGWAHRGWRGPRIYWHFPIVFGVPWFYPFYPYRTPPPVVQQPPAYLRAQPQPTDYWYYCRNPEGYYPYVRECPGGWMRVVPDIPR